MVEALYTVIFQQIHSETDQVKKLFAMALDEMYPVGLCLHILPGASLYHRKWVLGRTSEHVLGSVRFFIELPNTLNFASINCGISKFLCNS